MGDKPEFRVGVAGLDPRDLRLIEIVFRHSQYNKYAYRLVEPARGFDILIANAQSQAGERTIGAMRARGERRPVIAVLGRGADAEAERAIAIDRLTLQLLPILNRVVELELSSGESRAPEPAQAPQEVLADEAPDVLTADRDSQAEDRAEGRPSDRETVGSEEGRAAQGAGPAEVPFEETAGAGGDLAREGEARPVFEAGLEPESLPEPGPEAEFPPEPESAHEPRAAFEPAPEAEPGCEPGSVLETEPEVEHAPEPEAEHEPESQAEHEPESQAEHEPELGLGLEPEPAPEPEPVREGLQAAESARLVHFPGGGASAPSGADRRLRVLVVDDSPTVRRQLTVALDRLGLACETVESAARALERLAERHFDLALVDVVMPDADGYKLTRDIKRDKRLRQMPVIILTSRSSPFDLARGALSGCDAYLSKPVPFRALEAAVLKQLRRSLAIDDLAALTQGAQAGDREDQPRAESRLARLFRR